MVKKLGKAFLCNILESQVRRLRRKNDFKVIAVAGSVGKTTTKLAIAHTLAFRNRVCFQEGNYNDRLTVPLVLFGEKEPGIFNIFAWAALLFRTNVVSHQKFPYDYVVLELGSGAPGQLEHFDYLEPDIMVLTAISMEHMEFFKSIEAVAHEELTPMYFSKNRIVNVDDVDNKYLSDQTYIGYGFGADQAYKIDESPDHTLTIQLNGKDSVSTKSPMLGKQGAKAVAAAAAVAHQLGWPSDAIKQGLERVGPVTGRLQVLKGLNDSTLLDDTYNSSPLATSAALDVLYDAKAEYRIAILGSMNELGEESQAAHEEVANHCDPNLLAYIVTIGKEAEQYLAPIAKQAGCKVASFMNPVEAGNYVKEHMQPNSVILAKGSQNGVFAEEALKILLANPKDADKLVRQSKDWMAKKRQQFPDITLDS